MGARGGAECGRTRSAGSVVGVALRMAQECACPLVGFVALRRVKVLEIRDLPGRSSRLALIRSPPPRGTDVGAHPLRLAGAPGARAAGEARGGDEEAAGAAKGGLRRQGRRRLLLLLRAARCGDARPVGVEPGGDRAAAGAEGGDREAEAVARDGGAYQRQRRQAQAPRVRRAHLPLRRGRAREARAAARRHGGKSRPRGAGRRAARGGDAGRREEARPRSPRRARARRREADRALLFGRHGRAARGAGVDLQALDPTPPTTTTTHTRGAAPACPSRAAPRRPRGVDSFGRAVSGTP